MNAEFDKLANSYDNWHGELIKGSGFGREYFLEYKVKEVARVLARQNFTPKNILDFGCGVGDVEPYLQRYFPDANIFGVDISAESIETAKRNAAANGCEKINFAPLVETIPFDTTFDLVFVAGVFHHIPRTEHQQIISMIKTQLTQNAKIFIFELNPYNPATRHVFAKYEKPVDRNANLLPPAHIKNILRTAGFCTSRSIYTIFFPHALRIFLPMEKYLSRVPLGAHYYIFGEVAK
ncbi:MAG: class I SAM-dependent methyltransferase [Defluviitaleaceae bacterium]|nr:class I SAM-dependent methyltransferase [Defluviitaleaceae bacterium]MCL2263530.1 class I SAM-dependent methyltransferase [Defluviitaleaceae bacterium]